LTVTAAVLKSIAVTPANATIAQGTTEQFTATGTLSDGSTEDLTTSVSWGTSNAAAATIDTAGVATGVGPGSTDITATSGSVSGGTTLTVTNAATVSAVSVSWGTVGAAALQTASDGLRLLPVGRNTDLPWLGISSIAVTLSSSASLTSGDVSVSSADGINYGPITISGSGTNYVITLARPISSADRVTLAVANPSIATYTRRLDVLPGDANDDGAVNTTDGLLILRNETPAHSYQVFYDVNGDGSVNTLDFNAYRPKIGTVLPPVAAPAGILARINAPPASSLTASNPGDSSRPAPAMSTASAVSAVTSPTTATANTRTASTFALATRPATPTESTATAIGVVPNMAPKTSDSYKETHKQLKHSSVAAVSTHPRGPVRLLERNRPAHRPRI
jgi:trimeric autotransporter adhesin